MNKKTGIKLEGYKNTWSEISSTIRNGQRYFLMENDVWGDETCAVVVNAENKPICTTYDDIETALDDLF